MHGGGACLNSRRHWHARGSYRRPGCHQEPLYCCPEERALKVE